MKGGTSAKLLSGRVEYRSLCVSVCVLYAYVQICITCMYLFYVYICAGIRMGVYYALKDIRVCMYLHMYIYMYICAVVYVVCYAHVSVDFYMCNHVCR